MGKHIRITVDGVDYMGCFVDAVVYVICSTIVSMFMFEIFIDGTEKLMGVHRQ